MESSKEKKKKSRASVISHSVQAAELVFRRGRLNFRALHWSLLSCKTIGKDMLAMRKPVFLHPEDLWTEDASGL